MLMPTKNGDIDTPPGDHAGCIEWCKGKYTDEEGNKKRGRGACKANCWVSTAVRVLEAVAVIAPHL